MPALFTSMVALPGPGDACTTTPPGSTGGSAASEACASDAGAVVGDAVSASATHVSVTVHVAAAPASSVSVALAVGSVDRCGRAVALDAGELPVPIRGLGRQLRKILTQHVRARREVAAETRDVDRVAVGGRRRDALFYERHRGAIGELEQERTADGTCSYLSNGERPVAVGRLSERGQRREGERHPDRKKSDAGRKRPTLTASGPAPS